MEIEGGIQDMCLTQKWETNKMEVRKGDYKSKKWLKDETNNEMAIKPLKEVRKKTKNWSE